MVSRARRAAATFGFLLLALACYATGIMAAAGAFLLLGGIAEIVFWFRVLRRY